MKIDKVYLNYFRGIENLELELNGKSTILFGINGVGKSTILSAINLLYANIINKIVRQRFKQSANLELSDIKDRKAFASIAADFIFEQDNTIFPYERAISHDNKRTHQFKALDALVEHYEQCYVGEIEIDEDNNIVEKNPKFNIPIFANYGVNRLVLKTPLRIRRGPDFGQYSAFEKAIENQIAFGKLFEWLVEQEMYETMQKNKDSSYVDRELNAVKKAMLSMLDRCKDIHVVARPYSMKITKEEGVLDVRQLSDGEKCTLALFGDIARRLAIANPSLANPLEGIGVVLIDELELHMHTSWQRKAINVLNKTFPNVQFIITTHSPQVLGEVGEEYNIFSLINEEAVIKCCKLSSLYGLDTNSVLEDVLQTDSINKDIKEAVEQMYQCIEDNQLDEAEKIADRINELTINRNADTVRAQLLIKRRRRNNAQN